MALPRKAQQIDGLDASSLIGLNAAVYAAQRWRGGQPQPPAGSAGRGRGELFAQRNRGVEERDERARECEASERERAGSSLGKKSALYAQIMRGDAADEALGATAGESLVNWDRKQHARATLVSSDMQRDAERRLWEREAAAEVARGALPPSEELGARNSSVKRYLSDVVQEEMDDREHAVAERAKRERKRAQRRDFVAAKRAAVRKAAAPSHSGMPSPGGR